MNNSKVKISIEINNNDFEAIKKSFEEFKNRLGAKFPFATIEEYVASLITNFANSNDRINKLNEKFDELLKNLGGDIEAVPGFSDFLKSFPFSRTKTEDENKTKENKNDTSKLKN